MIDRASPLKRSAWIFMICCSLVPALTGACKRETGKPTAGRGERPAVETRAPSVPLAPVDACRLLTAEDAAAVLGGAVTEAKVSRQDLERGHSSHCAYLTERPLKVVNLLVEQMPTPRDAARAFDYTRSISKTVSGMEPHDLAGLGEKAFWEGGSTNKLHILKGNLWLILGASLGPGLDQEAPAKAAAQKVLEHT